MKDAEKDPKLTIAYPPTLNSFERRLIHKVADLIGGLNHESTGEGYDRHIVISLIPKQTEAQAKQAVTYTNAFLASMDLEAKALPAESNTFLSSEQ